MRRKNTMCGRHDRGIRPDSSRGMRRHGPAVRFAAMEATSSGASGCSCKEQYSCRLGGLSTGSWSGRPQRRIATVNVLYSCQPRQQCAMLPPWTSRQTGCRRQAASALRRAILLPSSRPFEPEEIDHRRRYVHTYPLAHLDRIIQAAWVVPTCTCKCTTEAPSLKVLSTNGLC